MEDPAAAVEELRLALATIAQAQARFLDDLRSRCRGADPRFSEAFRSWQLALTGIRLQLLRCEQQLLHYLLVPQEYRPWRELPAPTRVEPADCRRWQDLLAPWLHSLHIDTAYRRLNDPLDLRAEAATADLLTDLATVTATCEATGGTLGRLAEGCEPALLEELAFYHLLGPWKERASIALLDCLRWFDAFLAEHELL
jgi:hypothetical protein